MDLKSVRREYLRDGLRRSQLSASPLQQFDLWMGQAIEAGIKDPSAMTIATVAANATPSQRIVLLKQYDESGYVFYSNYQSHKGKELADNGKVSLHFPWHSIERQVRITGVCEKTSEQQSKEYFQSRPRQSQLAALISAQSDVVADRETLVSLYQQAEQRYQNADIPMPSNWGGYCVTPEQYEFWQGGAYRLHDRFRYRKNPATSAWIIERLAP